MLKAVIWIASYICPAVCLAVFCAITMTISGWFGLNPRNAAVIFLCVVILRAWSEEFRRVMFAAFNR